MTIKPVETKPIKIEVNLSAREVVDALGEIQSKFIEEQQLPPSHDYPYVLCSDLQSRYSLRKVNFFARNEDGTDQGNLSAFFPEPPPPTFFEFLADFGSGNYQLAWTVRLSREAQLTIVYINPSDNPPNSIQMFYDLFVELLNEWVAKLRSAYVLKKQKEYDNQERKEKEERQEKQNHEVYLWEKPHLQLLSKLDVEPKTRRRLRYCIKRKKDFFLCKENDDFRYLPADEWVQHVLDGKRNVYLEKFLSPDQADDLLEAIKKLNR